MAAGPRAWGEWGGRSAGRPPLASPPAHPASPQHFSFLPIPGVFEWGQWQVAFSLLILERTNREYSLWIQPSYVRRSRVTEYCKLGLLLCLGFLLMLPSALKAELMAAWVSRSHRRDFRSEERRGDDNHLDLKSLEACRAKLSGVLFRFNNIQFVVFPIGSILRWSLQGGGPSWVCFSGAQGVGVWRVP